jgi:hypothetical protein
MPRRRELLIYANILNPRITANNTNVTFAKRGLVTTDNTFSILLTTPIMIFDLN